MTNNFFELVNVTANNPRFRDLYILGLYLQEIDTMLWSGFPHIYANYRNLLEGIMNFMIKNDLRIEIKEGADSQNMTGEDFNQWISQVRRDKIPWESLRDSTMFVKENDFKFYHKIDLVESYCRYMQFDISKWSLHGQRKTMNILVHHIALPKDTVLGFRKRFELMRDFHDVIYRDFMKMHSQSSVGDYVFPTDSELKRIADLYNSRIDSYTYRTIK